ncbi:hypothetical protein [Streptomyces lichenis]|uniref:Lipoprotein n=1 Tax=Streptomyces lichenis TaxID=2306967 RepID=A0ABT0IHX0_9ACTN|nr:hypothetical protein [Streptomyces lichenis]MCK8680935.1 hypothetical protein [Streptomyces lichenis]
MPEFVRWKIVACGMMCPMPRLGPLRWENVRRALVFTMGTVLLVAGCSNGQSSSAANTGGPSAAAVENSPAQACTRDVLAALALKWREGKAPLDQDGKKLLQAFMDANMVEITPQYRIFIDHYAAGTGPIALAVAQGTDHEEAITEQLGTASEGVAADCAAAAG